MAWEEAEERTLDTEDRMLLRLVLAALELLSEERTEEPEVRELERDEPLVLVPEVRTELLDRSDERTEEMAELRLEDTTELRWDERDVELT